LFEGLLEGLPRHAKELMSNIIYILKDAQDAMLPYLPNIPTPTVELHLKESSVFPPKVKQATDVQLAKRKCESIF